MLCTDEMDEKLTAMARVQYCEKLQAEQNFDYAS